MPAEFKLYKAIPILVNILSMIKFVKSNIDGFMSCRMLMHVYLVLRSGCDKTDIILN